MALHEELRARVSALADRHRRELDLLFDELAAGLVAAPMAEPAAPVSLAKPVASPRLCEVILPDDTRPVTSPRASEVTLPEDPKTVRGKGGDRTSFASVSFSEGSFQEQAFHSGACARRPSVMAAQSLERYVSGRLGGSGPLASWLAEPVLRCLNWLAFLQEPPREGWAARVVTSKLFGFICFVVIALNAAFIVVNTDLEMAGAAQLHVSASLIETAFVVWYSLELLMKFWVHGLFFFVGREAMWNSLDVVLVVTSCVDVLATGTAKSGVNIGFMRSLRFFKLAKVLRVFRTVRFFSELRLMFDCVLGSLVSLVWCLVMIIFVVYVFALLIVQGLALEVWQPDSPFTETELQSLLLEFGSVSRAMIILFKSTTGGRDWGTVYDLLAVSGGFVSWAFLAYIVFFVLAAWNIVTSMFVEKALKLAQPDLETKAMEQNMQDVADAQELTAIFSELDADGSGTISLRELEGVITHPRFRTYLRVRGIEIQDARLFYKMMTSVVGGDCEDIDLHFVVAACLRMKGVATSMDLHALTFESKLLNKKHRLHIQEVQERLGRIEQRLGSRDALMAQL